MYSYLEWNGRISGMESNQASSQTKNFGGQAQYLGGRQYFFPNLCNCVVLKPIIFALLMQFAEASYLFVVTMNL